MNGGRRPLGYTIIEVMIVLAVSGVMFIIAANFISGKQGRTAFTAGVRETASLMQDTLDQIQNGKYSDIELNCRSGGARGGSIIIDDNPATTNKQGENPACVFLGKFIHLSKNGNAADYEIIPVAGNRFDIDGNPSTNPSSAGAQSVHKLVTASQIPQGLEVKKICVETKPVVSTVCDSYAVGWLQSQGSTDINTGPDTLLSGAQSVNLYFASGVDRDKDTTEAEARIAGSYLTQINFAEICLTDGTRYARLILGGKENPLSITTKIDGTTKQGVCV